MKEYYYSDGEGTKVGPISLAQLKKRKITEDTLVWYEGMSDWTNASELPELQELFIQESVYSQSTTISQPKKKSRAFPFFLIFITLLGFFGWYKKDFILDLYYKVLAGQSSEFGNKNSSNYTEEFVTGSDYDEADFSEVIEDSQDDNLIIIQPENINLANFNEDCIWQVGISNVSSTLPENSKNTYYKENLSDNDVTTAWVEGSAGDGIGDFFVVNELPNIIYNGYQKNTDKWKDNSRVKRFKIYINNLPYSFLELKDQMGPQYFDLNSGNEIEQGLSGLGTENIEVKFEIIEVYKGERYEDAAISEVGVMNCDKLSEMVTVMYVENLIYRYYSDIQNNHFNAYDYYAPRVDKYITKTNITPQIINDLYANENEYINPISKQIYDVKFERIQNGNFYYSFWMDFECFRRSKNKVQKCQIKKEIALNESNLITSYYELEVDNIEFFDVDDEIEVVYENSVELEDITDYPDQEATYPGGAASMKQFLADNIRYPETSMESGDQGKVFIEFVVEKNGSISSIKILRSVTKEIDREAKRVIELMPNWIPAELDGKPVRSRCRIPITFSLE